MKERRDDPETMARMRAWLEDVSVELELDPALVLDVDARLLGLIGEIAHGPSRPGASLSAYLVGVAVGRGADPESAIAAVSRLVGTRS